MQPLQQIITQIGKADQRQRKSIGVDEFEAEFVVALEMIKAHLELRSEVVGEFGKLLRNQSYGPYTLIEFCMHELRWPEMLVEAQKIYAAFREEVVRENLYGTPSQHLSYLENVISAFGEGWEDKDLFRYYGRTE